MFKFCCLLFALSAIGHAPSQTLQVEKPKPPRIFKAVRSPEVAADGKVTFRFFAPNAKAVSLSRDGAKDTKMTKDERGFWTYTTEPLQPDYYCYYFIVDGVQSGDPANTLMKPMITGGNENIVHVPGPTTLSWEENDVPHGVIHRHHYQSKVVGESRDFLVYTPPGYNPSARKTYPVLYLLHGVMESEIAWTNAGKANIILDNLIAQNKSKPMLIVMPLCYGFANAPDRVGEIFMSSIKQQQAWMDKVSETILTEIIPQVESSYKVGKNRESRAIAGLSMGGAESLYIGLNHLDKFANVGSFSGAFVMYGPSLEPWFPNVSKRHPKVNLVTIDCGTEDFLIQPNRTTKTWLKKQGFTLTEAETPGAHTWMVWRRNLTEFLPLLFR